MQREMTIPADGVIHL